MISGAPLICYLENWQYRRIDNRVWVLEDPDTGTDWTVDASSGKVAAYAAPDDTFNASITSHNTIEAGPSSMSKATSVWTSYRVALLVKLANVANINNAEFLIGLCSSNTAKRSTGGIDFIGFALSGDEYQSLVTDGGVEDAITHATYTPTDWNLLEYLIINDDVHFWINGTYIRKVDISSIDGPLYFRFYIESDGGSSAIYIAQINGIPDDSPVTDNYQTEMPVMPAKKQTDTPFLIRLVSRFNPREVVTGVADTDITVNYASNADVALNAYVPGASNWTELGEGWYLLNIGEDEFVNLNTTVEVTVKDARDYFADYSFIAVVTDITMDELIDLVQSISGPGTGTTIWMITNQLLANTNNVGSKVSSIRELVNSIKKNTDKENGTKQAVKDTNAQLDKVEKSIKDLQTDIKRRVR